MARNEAREAREALGSSGRGSSSGASGSFAEAVAKNLDPETARMLGVAPNSDSQTQQSSRTAASSSSSSRPNCPPGSRWDGVNCVPVRGGVVDESKPSIVDAGAFGSFVLTPQGEYKPYAQTALGTFVQSRPGDNSSWEFFDPNSPTGSSGAGFGDAGTEPSLEEEVPEEEVVEEMPMAFQRDPTAIFQGLANFLNSIGLGSLFSYSNGKPGGWLWNQIQSGIETRDELLFALEQTPEFKKRFNVIFQMREQNSPYVPTAAEVLEYEQGFFQLMNGSGVPTWFYDSVEDAQNAMGKGLALTQVEDRLQRGYQTMQRMPSEVRDVFSEYYGQSAEGAMLAAILDPAKTLNEIDRSVRVGQIGGFGRQAGFGITKIQAEQFAQLNLTENQIRAGIQQAAGLRPLTEETFGERLDLTEQTALQAGLGGSAVDEAILANRLRTRQLQQSTVGGGAAVSVQGITGAGVV